MAWRAADSLTVRSFVGLSLDAGAPNHSTISRTRRLIDVETHRAVFTWVRITPPGRRVPGARHRRTPYAGGPCRS